ncbi:Sterile Alpha Motif Domain-Containing Protein 15 [Manis pentadactyla]|nr:Sterile Alpha Motif Domain-Containing Protein 15 [Manis pentadactyla]
MLRAAALCQYCGLRRAMTTEVDNVKSLGAGHLSCFLTATIIHFEHSIQNFFMVKPIGKHIEYNLDMDEPIWSRAIRTFHSFPVVSHIPDSERAHGSRFLLQAFRFLQHDLFLRAGMVLWLQGQTC